MLKPRRSEQDDSPMSGFEKHSVRMKCKFPSGFRFSCSSSKHVHNCGVKMESGKLLFIYFSKSSKCSEQTHAAKHTYWRASKSWGESIWGFLSQPHFGQVWGWSPTLGKVESWSPPGLPNVQSSTARVKTPRIGVFLVSLERSWNVDIENGLALAIRTSAAQVMGKRRAGSQTGSQVENRCLPDIRFESATRIHMSTRIVY
jgi:hypothetical protein